MSNCSISSNSERGRRRQIAILTHNIFSWSYHAVLSSRSHLALLLLLDRGYSTWGLLWGAASSGALYVTVSWLRLRPSLTLTAPTAAGISIYHSITPMTSDELHHFFRLPTHVRLWLTARSRINMQHEESTQYIVSVVHFYQLPRSKKVNEENKTKEVLTLETSCGFMFLLHHQMTNYRWHNSHRWLRYML